MAYTDASTLKQYLDITSSTDDALLTSLIARAQKAIDTYTQRTFEASADTTKYFDAVRPYVNGALLSWETLGLDLCAVTTVTNGGGTTISSSNYVTAPRNTTPYYGLQLKANSGITWTYDTDWESAISITGRWAYSTSAPDDVAAVCIELASLMYKRRDTNSDINRPVIAGNATILPAGLSAESRQVLDSYKRRI